MLTRLTIAQRIWLLAIMSIMIFSSSYLFETFQKREQLMASKQEHLISLVEVAHTVMVGFEAKVSAGELSRGQAQIAAKSVIRGLRYQDQQYFWIHDMEPRAVMHPIQPELENQFVGDLQDKKGKKIYSEFVRVVSSRNAGFVDYYWTKGRSSQELFPKLSYVKGFQPWGWIVGTGVYIDDIDNEFNQELKNNLLFLALVLLFLMGASFFICASIIKPLRATTAAMRDIAAGDGDLTVRIDAEGHDELANLAAGFNGFTAKVQRTVLEVQRIGEHLVTSAESMAVVTAQTNQSLSTHQEETLLVATAVHQMSATVEDVSRNAADAAKTVQLVRTSSLDGQLVVQQSIGAINQLAGSVDQAVVSILALETEVQNITGILDVIRAIADQTNLLALNAAIEAARAGEQGRGFAVVADEVRTLAQRTQESTQKIQLMIGQLQNGANNAVNIIRAGRAQAEVSVELANNAGEALTTITDDVLEVANMNTQIAAATEEQSATVEMINHNINNINQAFTETASGAEQIARSGIQLKQLAENLQQQLSQFKI